MFQKAAPVAVIVTLFASPAPAQSWRLPDPEFEQRGFLLTPDIPEMNVDFALSWTDSTAALFVSPFDAVILHVGLDGEEKDVFIFSDAGMNRLTIFECSKPEEEKRTIEKIQVYRGDDIGGLKMPSGMATNAAGREYEPGSDVIFLCDRGNDRILELTYYPDQDGGKISYNRTLGAGHLKYPVDVAIANYGGTGQSESDLYIVDIGDDEHKENLVRISIDNIFEGSWHRIQFPGRSGFGWDIKIPVAIACTPDTTDDYEAIYLTEGATNVMFRLVSKTDGAPKYSMTHELERGSNYWKPGGIAFDDYRRIYVANQTNGCFELVGPDINYQFGKFGEPGEGPGQFFLPSNIIIDTYHGFCEALILEWYGRQSGIQTWIITNGASATGAAQGFVANNLVRPPAKAGAEIPKQFALYDAYPNPFNSKCKISFDLPEQEHVLIQVFNILGQKMLTLLDEDRDAGTHTVVFDAADLSSGVYFYRIMSGSWTDTKSVVLLK